MFKMKKAITLTLVLSLVSSLFAGCGQSSSPAPSSSAAPATSAASTAAPATPAAPAEISLCMSQTSWGSSIDPGLMESFKSKIEKATNTKIKMIAPPHNAYQEKLNVLLTSGEIPDAYTVMQALDFVPVYAVRGYAAPLDNYLSNDKRLAMLKDFDLSSFDVKGKKYGIPTNRPMNKIIWVRQDMIDKYKLNISPQMKTQEFIDEMKKVDQKQNIPFTFPKWVVNFQLFYDFFGAYAGIIKDKSGKYFDGFQTPEMKEAILYIKSLYDAGILDKEFITNENSMMREKTFTGKAASTCDYYYNYLYFRTQSAGVGKGTDFVPVHTLVGPRGDKGNLNESFQNAMCISPKSKNADAAASVISWLYFSEEGAMLTKVGIEGEHYTLKDGVITATEKAASSGYSLNAGTFTLSFPVISKFPFKWGGILDEGYPKQVEILKTSQSKENLGPKLTVPMGISDIYDKNVATYATTQQELVVKVVLGNKTIDQAYADYTAYWKSIQGDKMLEQLNK